MWLELAIGLRVRLLASLLPIFCVQVDLLMGITPVADFFLRTRQGRLGHP